MPSAFGSGKFDTPWDRMQSAYAIARAFWLVPADGLLDLPEDPQAVIATAQVTAASAIDRLWRGCSARLLALALRMSWNSCGFIDAGCCTGPPVTGP